MSRRISWLTGADRFILQFLEGHENPGFHAPPTLIASNIDYSASHVRARVRILTEARLTELVNENRGYYATTDLARRLLSGGLTEEEAEKVETVGRNYKGGDDS